jgi:hypothetical protein
MEDIMEFEAFPKISRFNRKVTVTEKLDGTNAAIVISTDVPTSNVIAVLPTDVGTISVYAQSRSRFITPTDDNYGFAAWVSQNARELLALGVGRHFGEWWGAGIQRRYNINEKRFSLFNTRRWRGKDETAIREYETFPNGGPPVLVQPALVPDCCHVVPILFEGQMVDLDTEVLLAELRNDGSVAAPGFIRPEGIVVYHEASNMLFKRTCEKDESPKGK